MPGKHRSAPSCRLPAPPSSHGHRAAPQGGCPPSLRCDGGSAPRWGRGGPCRSALPPVVAADTGDDARKPRRVQQSKNWTFPNAKACGAADPFVCPAGGLEGLHRPVQVRAGCGTPEILEYPKTLVWGPQNSGVRTLKLWSRTPKPRLRDSSPSMLWGWRRNGERMWGEPSPELCDHLPHPHVRWGAFKVAL